MSVGVSVIPPPGFPDPREPIVSFARCPGNIMMAPEVLGRVSLDQVTTPPLAALLLADVIAELDKGDAGKFSDQWCADADMRWSGGREMKEAWAKVYLWQNELNIPPYMRARETYWGHVTRERLRETAMRFFLYYSAGYEVRWSP